MTVALPEPPAPTGVASQAALEAALQGGAVRLSGWNLAEASFDDLDLRRCEFVRCRGGRAEFSSCDLTEARFINCDFNNARWRWGTLASAMFVDCKLTGAQIIESRSLGLGFERCLLVNAHLRGLSFRRASLDEIDFSGADLAGADFREAVLTGCNLRDANLTGARFDGADLRGADLGGLKLADASRFKGAMISRRQAADLLSGLGLKVL